MIMVWLMYDKKWLYWRCRLCDNCLFSVIRYRVILFIIKSIVYFWNIFVSDFIYENKIYLNLL